MSEFSDFVNLAQADDPYNCQAWEACAAYYHDRPGSGSAHDRHLVDGKFTPYEGDSRGHADDATWILTSSFVIFTMQSGFGLLEAGSCSHGYEVNIMMKNIVDVAFTSLTYYLVGYGISFGEPSTPFTGKGCFPADGGYDEVLSGLLYSKYIFQLAFAATSTTIVSGAVAMRLKFSVYVLYSVLAVVFYSFVAHWVFDEGGFLMTMGAHDHAGGAPVHVFGGVNALVAALFLGPRLGRFDGTRPITDFLPSSPANQCLGLLALWWGWIGFNCGSSFGITDDRWVVAIRSAVTTINSSVGGGITALIYTLWRTKGKLVIPEHIINGILGSLVAITPSCACVHSFDAFPIGVVGALVGLGINTLVCNCGIDDPVGAVGVHAGSGMWGLLSIGFFADSQLPGIEVKDGLFRGGGFELLGLQALATICTIGWAVMWSTGFFYFVGIILSRDWRNPRKGLRVLPEEEEQGADCYLHGIGDEQDIYMASLDDYSPEDRRSRISDMCYPNRTENNEEENKRNSTFNVDEDERPIDVVELEDQMETIKEQNNDNSVINEDEDESPPGDAELKDRRSSVDYRAFLKFLYNSSSYSANPQSRELRHPRGAYQSKREAIDTSPSRSLPGNAPETLEQTRASMQELDVMRSEIISNIHKELMSITDQIHADEIRRRRRTTLGMPRRQRMQRASTMQRPTQIYR